jgi:hypothetical protein
LRHDILKSDFLRPHHRDLWCGKTILQEFYQVAFRKKLYDSIDALQVDLDEWLHSYNHQRTHQGKMCCGRTPFETMIDGKEIWQEKFVN